jgi:hypothetical protein
MESLIVRGVRRLGLFLLSVSFIVPAGCVTTGVPWPLGDCPPGVMPCQVMATWVPQVGWTPDPTKGGQPGPVLAGRMYLFGPEVGFPLLGDGRVVVDLWDETPTLQGGEAVFLEEWVINRDDLKRLMKKDAIGPGYTLVLPWGTYRPDITRIQLKLRYEPVKGYVLYAQSSPVTLGQEEGPMPALTGRNGSPPAANAAAKPGTSGPHPPAPLTGKTTPPPTGGGVIRVGSSSR